VNARSAYIKLETNNPYCRWLVFFQKFKDIGNPSPPSTKGSR